MMTNTTPQAATAKPRRGAVILRVAIMLILVGGLIFLSMQMGAHQTRNGGYHTPAWALLIHLFTVIPALPLGAWVLARRKGTPGHKIAGKVWMTLMFVTAIDSFWIRTSGSIGPIHILSAVTIVMVPLAIWQVKRGNIAAHKRIATGLYIGLIVAGTFTLLPGRLIGNWVFG